MRRLIRGVGTLLVVGGLATLAWSATVWLWQDPLTYLYTRLEQRALASDYAQRADELRGQDGSIAASAKAYADAVRPGDAIGRITVPRLGLKRVIVVNGT